MKLQQTRRNSRCFNWLVGFVLILICLSACGGNRPPLESWHTVNLSAEYSSGKADQVKTFEAYLQLEDELFDQMAQSIYAPSPTGKGFLLFRYSSGSAADPGIRKPNWNRSFELAVDDPIGGIVLLHGMSDSPYSLRALGETLHQRNYWVIGPRMPGHGTTPAGLKKITWEDMADIVRLAVNHLAAKVGSKPIHIVGYSTGAPLALNFTLDALEGNAEPIPSSLVLISPAIGIHPLAGLARLKNGLSYLPGLGRMAWVSIQPEFDPYKYNSFATNAGTQVHRLTRSVGQRIARWPGSASKQEFPPTLVFQSTVDATVSTPAVVDRLLKPLGTYTHELVLFDINRFAAKSMLMINDPGPVSASLMADDTLPFAIKLVTNQNPETVQVGTRHKDPFSEPRTDTELLDLVWPAGVVSLSHVALPFSPNDPLYGRYPPEDNDRLYLGNIALQGERGLLNISYEWLFRLRHNPFYDFLEQQTLQWIDTANNSE